MQTATMRLITINIYSMFPNGPKCFTYMTPWNPQNNLVDGIGAIIMPYYRWINRFIHSGLVSSLKFRARVQGQLVEQGW